MTPATAISLAESARWTVVGTSQRKDACTLFLTSPLGRRFQITLTQSDNEESFAAKLDELKQCPF